MKRFLILFLVLVSTAAYAQTNKTPILRGLLQSDLDGNGKSVTNAGTLRATNFIDAATGLSIGGVGITGAVTNGETRVVLLKNTLQLGSGTNTPNGELDLQASDGSVYSVIARTAGLGLLLDQAGIKVADAVIEASGNGYFKGNGAGLNNITGIPGTIFTNGQDLVAGAAAAPTYTLLSLMPGAYNYTNTIQLKEGQLLVGSGRGNTFLKFWGYSSNSTQPVGDDWVGISLQTNILIKALDIRNMVSNVNSFQASIGRRTNAGAGATGFKIEDVSMHGDTDNFYIDNSGLYQGDLINCYFDGHWDVAVHTALTENSWLNFWNPTVTVAGYSTSKGASQPANPFRFGVSGAGTNRAIRIFGGNVSVTNGVVANAGGAPVSIYGLRYNNNGWGTNFQGVFNFYDMDVDYSKIRSITLNQEGLAIGAHDVQPQGAGLEENAYFGNPPAGTAYYNTNTYAWRVFDGLSWKSVLAAMNTNTLLVSGASDSSYNGIYTWKQGGLGTSFGAFTNVGGKFLVGSTNTTADAVYALSSTLSISNGLEYTINTTPQLERGWDFLDSEDNPVNIRVSLVYSNYYDGNGAAITNLPASAIWSGTLAAARMPALTGVITTSAGAVATSFAASPTFTGTITLNGVTRLNAASNTTGVFTLGLDANNNLTTNVVVSGTDPGNAWKTNGNSGMTGSRFAGTTDGNPFKLQVNGETSATFKTNYLFTVGSNQTDNVSSPYSAIIGGHDNSYGDASHAVTVIGGQGNTNGSGGSNSIIAGGYQNAISNATSLVDSAGIFAGDRNRIGAAATDSVVLGGKQNSVTGARSAIAGGNANIVSGADSFAAGNQNTASGARSVALGSAATAGSSDTFVWSPNVTFSDRGASTFNIGGDTYLKYGKYFYSDRVVLGQLASAGAIQNGDLWIYGTNGHLGQIQLQKDGQSGGNPTKSGLSITASNVPGSSFVNVANFSGDRNLFTTPLWITNTYGVQATNIFTANGSNSTVIINSAGSLSIGTAAAHSTNTLEVSAPGLSKALDVDTNGNTYIGGTLTVTGTSTHVGLLKLNAGTNAATVVNLGLDVNGFVSTNASAIGGGGSGGTNSGPITLSLSGTNVAVSCTCPSGVSTNSVLPFRFTCTTNFLLQNPTGGNDGQTIRFEFIEDATGGRLIFLDTKWGLGTDITGITLTTTAAKRDFMTATYNSTADKWYITGFTRGY